MHTGFPIFPQEDRAIVRKNKGKSYGERMARVHGLFFRTNVHRGKSRSGPTDIFSTGKPWRRRFIFNLVFVRPGVPSTQPTVEPTMPINRPTKRL